MKYLIGTHRESLRRIAALIVAALLIAPFAVQPAGAQQMPGGMPSMPKNIFQNKDKRVVSGPSLSATDEPVAEIRIAGNSTIPTSQILDKLQTRVGRQFDPALVQKDVLKLVSLGWFVTVQPSYEQSANGRIVIFTVAERPVIRFVEYLGNKGIRTKKLNKETDLKVGGPVDPYAVEEARKKIIALYKRSGYNNVQVTILKGNKPTDNGVVFVINEGTAQKIWKVVFEGNEFASDGQLRTKIETKKPLMYIFKGFVDRETIDADVDKLTAYYRSFGFFQAKVGRIPELDEDGKWMTLRFVIHEGPRYDVESVSFIGNRVFKSDSLAMGIELPSGKPFEQALMNKDLSWLKDLYGSQGYVFADIQAEPIFLEQPGKLKLLYKIEEGKRWRIGNIVVHINGDNPHTKIQTALNRLSMRSGEIADSREIRASERRLQACGLFLYEPARGVVPKITYRIPELDETQVAEEDGPSFRSQSPDPPTRRYGAWNLVQDTTSSAPLAAAAPTGPPLIAPPGANPPMPASSTARTYMVQKSTGLVPREDEVDVHVYLTSAATAAAASELPAASTTPAESAPAEMPLSPTAIRHEVRRAPYDNPYAAAHTSTSANQRTSAYHPQPATTYAGQRQNPPAQPASNPYRRLVVRSQSPYQPPTAQTYPPSSGAPATYGGQTVGATGPDAASTGTNPYATQPATSTPSFAGAQRAGASDPQVRPAQYTSDPVFGAPPVAAPGVYAPAPQYAAPPLGPDPNITPIPPVGNPRFTPYPADPFTPMFTDPAVDLDVVLSEAQTGRLMLGVAVNSDAGLVGQILLDEQNFDWSRWPTSWDDFLSGKAFRGAGQRFRIEAAPGTEVQRYLVSFTEPYLMDTPVSLGLSGSYFDRRYDDWDEQRLGGRVSFGYQWTADDVSSSISYRGESVKITNPSTTTVPELNEVLGENALHGFKWSIANDTRNSSFLATEGHFFQLELEQVIGSFEYPRAIVEGRKYFLLNERPDHTGRHVLTAASRVGFTGEDTPIYDRFYAGGYSTLRGFDFRGASPVSPGTDVVIGGDFLWVNTIEYLFPITADDMIHGVVFTDFGTVEEDIEIEDFRVAPGFGLRITVPAMGPAPIALDFAFPVLEAEFDDEQVFSFNIGLQH